MKKYIKISLVLTVLSTNITCSDSNSSPTPTKSILKRGPSYTPTTRPTKQTFYKSASRYQDIHPEKATPQQRHQQRLNAQIKKQKLARQQQSQISRSAARRQANINWQLDGSYNPPPYTADLLLLDEQERNQKLQTLRHAMEISPTFTLQEQIEQAMTVEEQLGLEKAIALEEQLRRERPAAYEDAVKTTTFMKLATMDPALLQQDIPYFFLPSYRYSKEISLIIDFIIETLIKEKIIADMGLQFEDFGTKITELNKMGVLDPQAFQQFIHTYLETHDYSFLQSPVPPQPQEPLVEYVFDDAEFDEDAQLLTGDNSPLNDSACGSSEDEE